MKSLLKVFCLFIISLSILNAQGAATTIETTKVANGIYEMFIYRDNNSSVNIFAFIGTDGVMLIDAGFQFSTDLVKNELKKLTDKKIKYIINTHSDGDHTGGNKILASDASVISHKNFNSGLSGISVYDSLLMNFNGEEISIRYMPGHTLTDLVVHLKNSNIAFIGDLVFSDSFPLVHPYGDIYLYQKTLATLSKMFNNNTRILPGHGREINQNEITVYNKMFLDTKNLVAKEIKKCKFPPELKKANILKEWQNWNSKLFINVNSNRWIDNLYSALNEGKKLSAFNFLKNVYDKSGVKELLATYSKDVKQKGRKLYFSENDFNNWGYDLLAAQKINDAIEIFKINTMEFPESANTYDSLGEAYAIAGNKELAIKNYQKSFELNPQNINALDQIKKMKE